MTTVVFRASSLVDTDVSERPVALFFKGMCRRALTNLLGPPALFLSSFPPLAYFSKTLVSIGQLTQP